jgi:hypothetical protein
MNDPCRMRWIGWGVAVWLALLAAGQAAHAMTLREMRALEQSDTKQGPLYVNYYLVGVVEGAIEAHAHAVRAGGKARFCVSGRIPEPRRARAIVDAELRRNAHVYEADMPVELVVMNALANIYPC